MEISLLFGDFMEETTVKVNNKPDKKLAGLFIRIFSVLMLSAALVLFFLLGIIFLLSRGPSPAARDLFVRSVQETSAIGFLAHIFLTPEEVSAIMAPGSSQDLEGTDASLINISQHQDMEPKADQWGHTDEDGDGIIIVPVKGESYVGNMMIVLDPSRVVLGCDPETLGSQGHTLEEFVHSFGAVAGINGGGFEDDNGQGDGSMPNSAIVADGEIYCGVKGVGRGFVGIDSDNILHVGFKSVQELIDRDIQHGAGYGPVLVVNGKAADSDSLSSGLNPRTAIGQRSDGAILMLVIDGRQASSLGATYEDEADIMLEFGAVNACNLDGGSSSLMWYDGGYINNCASVIGIRNNPTSFLVLAEGEGGNG